MNRKLIVGIFAILIFSWLLLNPNTKRHSRLPNVQTSETSPQEPNSTVYGYYSSIEDAIANNTFAEGEPADYTIQQKIKILEDEQTYLLYATNTQPGGEEIFSLFMFKTRIKQGIKEYSNPISHFPILKDFIMDSEKNKGLEKAQQDFLSLFNLATKEEKITEYPNFVWSLSADNDVYNLKVNGEKPTEIIPFKLDSHQIYYYYFNDLEKQDDFVVTVQ